MTSHSERAVDKPVVTGSGHPSEAESVAALLPVPRRSETRREENDADLAREDFERARYENAREPHHAE